MDDQCSVHDFSNGDDKDTLGSILAAKPPTTDMSKMSCGEAGDTLGAAMSRRIAAVPFKVVWWRDNPHFSATQ